MAIATPLKLKLEDRGLELEVGWPPRIRNHVEFWNGTELVVLTAEEARAIGESLISYAAAIDTREAGRKLCEGLDAEGSG
jgi:hypothetical protein